MTKSAEELLAVQVGEGSVAENLRRAVASGALIENDDGTLQLADDQPRNGNWVAVNHGPPMDCKFLLLFLFPLAYAKSAVPQGCSACYKVKVMPRTLRELVAAWDVAKRIECKSKWGADLGNPYSQNIYAGYFYTAGLDMARTIYKIVRHELDSDPKLGPDIAMSIKRGCSEYEALLGPSDRYEFAPELAELEAHLKAKFRVKKRPPEPALPLAHWIDVAFRVGDDTYLDFTAGKRLRPKAVSYDP